MKLFCTSILLFLFANCFAQDYRLFPKGQKAMFIDTTLGAGLAPDQHYLFDPVATFLSENVNHDSLFNLNREEFYDGNIISLFSYSILNNSDQQLNTNIGTYTLLRNAALGSSWQGFENNEQTLETITYQEKTWESVLGVMDSVKNYSLSGGRVIKISKNFGLLEVPVAYGVRLGNSEPYSQLRLFSINSFTPQYNLRDYRTVFSFNKGYIYGGGDFQNMGFEHYTVRLEILEKTIEPDSIVYEIARWEKETPFPPNCGSNCVATYSRDTFTLVVKENVIRGNPDWMSLENIYQKDLAYVRFDGNDTIFSVGLFSIFEGPTTYLSTSATRGYVARHEEAGSPFSVEVMDFRFYCYYPKQEPDPACQNIEDLTPTYESISAATQISIFYNPESREINLSSSTISGAKISLVDAQGRILYSTYPQSSEVKIPCANTNGFYQLLIESEKGNFRRGIVVY